MITVLKLIASAIHCCTWSWRMASDRASYNFKEDCCLCLHIIIDLQKRKRLFGDHHLGSRSASLINTHCRAVNSGTKTAYVIVPDPFSARLGCVSRKRVWPHETKYSPCDVTSFSPCTDSSHELRDLQHFMSEQIDLNVFKAITAASCVDIIVNKHLNK